MQHPIRLNYGKSGRINVKFLNNFSNEFSTQTMTELFVLNKMLQFSCLVFLTTYLNSYSVTSTLGNCIIMLFLSHKNNRSTI
jgi:hypothetical protein